MSAGKFILGTIIAVTVGALLYTATAAGALMKTCFKPRGITGLNIDFLNLKLFLNYQLIVKNKSPLLVKIIGYKFDVLLNGSKVGIVGTTTDQSLAPNAYSILNVPVAVNIGSVLGQVLSGQLLQLYSENKLDQIKITLRGEAAGIAMKIPVSKKIDITQSLAELLAAANAPAQPC